MSEHGLFTGYMGVAPQHNRLLSLPRPATTNTKLYPVSPLPGIVREAKPSGHMPNVSKIGGMPAEHMKLPNPDMVRIKPSATKSTPGMIKVEMR